jgi:hypothetical protein
MGFGHRFMRNNAKISNNDTPRVSGTAIGPGRTQQPERSQTPKQQSDDAITSLAGLKAPLNLSLKNPNEKAELNKFKPKAGGGFRSIGK